jgi:hypothetical protein
MLNISKEDCFVLGFLAAVVIWTYGVVPLLPEYIGTVIAAFSAAAAAASAIAAWRSAAINYSNSQRQFENSQRQFEEARRQLTEVHVNACLDAAVDVLTGVYKTIDAKVRKDPEGLILGYYEGEAWKSWVLLAKTFRVARAYDRRLEDLKARPGELADLLSGLRASLSDPDWDGEGPRNIRPAVKRIVDEIHIKVGEPPP